MFQSKRLSIILTLTFLLLSFVAQVKAQNEHLLAAEKLYQQGYYYAAIHYYTDFLLNKKSDKAINAFTGYLSKQSYKNSQPITNQRLLASYHLANCYRLLSDYMNAEVFYDSCIAMEGLATYPEIGYFRGVCLRANGKLAEAKMAFNQYLVLPTNNQLFNDAANKELTNIAFAEKELSTKNSKRFTIQKLYSPINGNESNYAPYIINQQLYFSSTRPDSALLGSKINPYRHHIYATSYPNNQAAKVEKLNFQQNNNDIDQGAVSFSADGKVVFFSQWEEKYNQKIGAIFISYKTDSGWTKPFKMDTAINTIGFTSQQPFISANGQFLFFSSNKPNGYGKFDIWCAELSEGYKVKKVTNLGNTINTKDNEKAPYFNETNATIVFASDGLVGMGGYDLFYSRKKDGHFGLANNIGSPINSFKDDEYFFASENTKDFLKNALVSSDRSSNCCLEIFAIEPLPAQMNRVMGTVKDNTTLLPLDNVLFSWQNDKIQSSIHLTNNGKYDMIVPDTASYIVKLSATNYSDTTVFIDHIFRDAEDSVFYQDFYLRPMPPLRMPIAESYLVYFDFNKFEINDSARTVLDSIATLLANNSNWKVRIEGYTDGKGSDDYNLALSKSRANTCFQYFKSLNIDQEKLILSFYGEANPVAPNNTLNGDDYPEGRQLNRRVKISIIKNE